MHIVLPDTDGANNCAKGFELTFNVNGVDVISQPLYSILTRTLSPSKKVPVYVLTLDGPCKIVEVPFR